MLSRRHQAEGDKTNRETDSRGLEHGLTLKRITSGKLQKRLPDFLQFISMCVNTDTDVEILAKDTF